MLPDWGDEHFSCFRFAYDWRLDRFIEEKKRYVQEQIVRLRIFTTQPYGWRKAGGWRTLTRRGF
jgi:hypothetical protein